MSLILEGIDFGYESSGEELFTGLDLHFPVGWTGVVGPNGSGKTSLLRLALGELEPTRGRRRGVGSAASCVQRTDDAPAGLDALLASDRPEAFEWRGRLEVEDDFARRWSSLSHGERKRAQLACALFEAPELLAIDEPTNHLDAEARRLVMEALERYPGVGLLVSHDRELLDRLCTQCVFLDPPEVRMRPGGYSQGREEARREAAEAEAAHREARRSAGKLAREAQRRREEASRADRRRSKRGIARKDHDAKARIDAARVSGQDGAAGRRSRQLQARQDRAEQRVADTRATRARDLGIAWKGESSRRDRVLRMEATTLELGGGRRLHVPELELGGTERVAVQGPNGAGKSTLIRHLLDRVELPEDQLCFVPQELPAESARRLVTRVRALPRELRGELMMVVSRLGSDPRRVLRTELPSPGEARKLLFALGRVREPALIVMDEPTNHLDLPSIECLEEALAGCPCALLLVSHDRRFCRALTDGRWVLGKDGSLRRESW